jgi:tripartite-type tricarboxylate transporter receptor subunit TctC
MPVRLGRLVTLGVAALIAASAPWTREAAAQDYPTRPVRIIVPSSPGGGTDTAARLLAQHLSDKLGQQFYIENRPGAGSMTGIEAGARATPDGYTLLMGNISQSISMTLYSRPGFDILKDFAPVTSLAHGSFTLAAHPSLPAKTVKELIAFARKRPGEVNVATAGSALRLAAKMLDSMAGMQTTEIQYKSTPQAITAVVSGETSVGFPATSSAIPYARSGKLRALAVTTPKRSSMAPDVPTVAESGVPGYDVTTWYGLLVPAATSKEIIARLNGAAVNTLTNPAVKKLFAQTDLEPNYSTPEQFGAYIRSEVAKWAKVIKESGITIE